MSSFISKINTPSINHAHHMRTSLADLHHGLDFYQALNDFAMHNVLQAQQPVSPGEKPGPRLVPRIEMSQDPLPLPVIRGIEKKPSCRAAPNPHDPTQTLYSSTIDSTQEMLDAQQANTVTHFLLRIREGLLGMWKKMYQAMED